MKNNEFKVEPKHLSLRYKNNLKTILKNSPDIDTLIVSRNVLNTNKSFLMATVEQSPQILHVTKGGKSRADLACYIKKTLAIRRKSKEQEELTT